MTNFRIVKNTEWKEVEINGKKTLIPIDFFIKKIKDMIVQNKNSKVQAGDLQKNGLYRAFSASKDQENFLNEWMVDGQNIFLPIGGMASVSFFDGRSAYTMHVFSFKSREDFILTKMLFHYIEKNIQDVGEMFQGTGLQYLNKKQFMEYEVQIPQIKNQNKIVKILSDHESLIENMEALIEKQEERFRYLSEELLSGRIRVKEVDGKTVLYKNPDDNLKEVYVNGKNLMIPSDWKKEKIEDCMEIICGKTVKKMDSGGKIPTYGGIGISFYTENPNQKDKWIIQKSAISKKFVRFVSGDFYMLSSSFTFSTKNENENFIGYKIQTMQGYIHEFIARGGAVKNINMHDFIKTEIVFPKKQEQDLIVKIFSQQEELISHQKAMLEKEKRKFQWLLDNFLSGKYFVE